MKYGPQSNLEASSPAFETRHAGHFSSQTPGTGSQSPPREAKEWQAPPPPLLSSVGGGSSLQ